MKNAKAMRMLSREQPITNILCAGKVRKQVVLPFSSTATGPTATCCSPDMLDPKSAYKNFREGSWWQSVFLHKARVFLFHQEIATTWTQTFTTATPVVCIVPLFLLVHRFTTQPTNKSSLALYWSISSSQKTFMCCLTVQVFESSVAATTVNCFIVSDAILSLTYDSDTYDPI